MSRRFILEISRLSCLHLKSLARFIALCVSASSCSFIQKSREIVFAVSVPETLAVRFEGKGAAAGVMMSSSMGPMGVAIGVAIDEGIAKDIRGALDGVDCRMDKIVEISFAAISRNYGVGVAPISSPPASRLDIVVQVDEVKFRAFPSERDLTLAEVAMTIDRGGVVYELASTSTKDAGGGIPLEAVRTDGHEACHLLQAEFTHLLDAWYQQQQK